MKTTRFTVRNIIGNLKEIEAGMKVTELYRKHAFPVSPSTSGA
jgi:hypothetical protein